MVSNGNSVIGCIALVNDVVVRSHDNAVMYKPYDRPIIYTQRHIAIQFDSDHAKCDVLSKYCRPSYCTLREIRL